MMGCERHRKGSYLSREISKGDVHICGVKKKKQVLYFCVVVVCGGGLLFVYKMELGENRLFLRKIFIPLSGV